MQGLASFIKHNSILVVNTGAVIIVFSLSYHRRHYLLQRFLFLSMVSCHSGTVLKKVTQAAAVSVRVSTCVVLANQSGRASPFSHYRELSSKRSELLRCICWQCVFDDDAASVVVERPGEGTGRSGGRISKRAIRTAKINRTFYPSCGYDWDTYPTESSFNGYEGLFVQLIR